MGRGPAGVPRGTRTGSAPGPGSRPCPGRGPGPSRGPDRASVRALHRAAPGSGGRPVGGAARALPKGRSRRCRGVIRPGPRTRSRAGPDPIGPRGGAAWPAAGGGSGRVLNPVRSESLTRSRAGPDPISPRRRSRRCPGWFRPGPEARPVRVPERGSVRGPSSGPEPLPSAFRPGLVRVPRRSEGSGPVPPDACGHRSSAARGGGVPRASRSARCPSVSVLRRSWSAVS